MILSNLILSHHTHLVPYDLIQSYFISPHSSRPILYGLVSVNLVLFNLLQGF
jgi:hypothetical protein